ncbi:hypothetical protein DICVIV_11742 [Dictyocaulus viviparus]|uniref:Uncharacterized protein n=1 Tax=Dictyocaulus viviparus TaxID=29172 RepID=A0A0D8XCE8_DICVI|nr:hypothetical protein DICVIV_11742 [Dictyocaulus viviparus]
MEILKMTTAENGNMELAADLKIAVGAMEFTEKVAKDVMTPIEDVFMLSQNEILDTKTMTEIVDKGYTRIPVYEDGDRNKVPDSFFSTQFNEAHIIIKSINGGFKKALIREKAKKGSKIFNSVTSLLFVKDLALIDKKNNIPVKAVAEFNKRQLRIVREDMPLPKLLDEFKEGNYHLAMVRNVRHLSNSDTEANNKQTEAQDVTLEDILEEILQSEIFDESDIAVDNVNRRCTKRHMQEAFCCEARSDGLSLNMLEVVSGWLIERYTIFQDQHLEEKTREKLIQKNIRHVAFLSRNAGDETVYLYEAGKFSKRFILILEGKAVVTFPKCQMSFDIGPFTSFGDILLQKLSSSIRIRQRQETHCSFQFTPDFYLIAHESCRFLQLPTSHIVQALRISQVIKQLSTPVEVTTSNDGDSVPLLHSGADEKFSHKRSIGTASLNAPEKRLRSMSMVPMDDSSSSVTF